MDPNGNSLTLVLDGLTLSALDLFGVSYSRYGPITIVRLVYRIPIGVVY